MFSSSDLSIASTIAIITAEYVETRARCNPCFHITQDFFCHYMTSKNYHYYEDKKKPYYLTPLRNLQLILPTMSIVEVGILMAQKCNVYFSYDTNCTSAAEVGVLLLPEFHNCPEERARNSMIAGLFAHLRPAVIYAERAQEQGFAMLDTFLLPSSIRYSAWEDLAAIDAMHGNVSEKFFSMVEIAITQIAYLEKFLEEPHNFFEITADYFSWLETAKAKILSQSHPKTYKSALLSEIHLLESLSIASLATLRNRLIQTLEYVLSEGYLLKYIDSLQSYLATVHFEERQAHLESTIREHRSHSPDTLAIIVAGREHTERLKPTYPFLRLKTSTEIPAIDVPSQREELGIGEMLALFHSKTLRVHELLHQHRLSIVT